VIAEYWEPLRTKIRRIDKGDGDAEDFVRYLN